jgi:hypothetical protein
MSPVFPPPAACEDLGGGKIRPVVRIRRLSIRRRRFTL